MAPDSPSRRTGVSRRALLKGGGVAAFGVASLAALQLPFFDVEGAEQDPEACKATDVSAEQMKLIISNWPAYIDPKGNKNGTFQRFQNETGITVDYTDDVNDNSEFYAKVRNQLGACEPINRDMMVLTDWMAARMIGLGWIQPLDKAKVPNLHANLIDSLAHVGWDEKREYSAPWQSGVTGIAYNKAKVKEVRTFDELLTRSDLKGRISLLTEMRDTMGLTMLSEGIDPSDFQNLDWENAVDKLRKSRRDGQVRAFTGNEYVQDLSAGNVLACEAWSGDVAAAEDPNLVFVQPEEGMMIWADNMLIPNLATHHENAERWIDYYFDPAVAAKLAAYVWYICPVKGAKEEMEKIDPSLVDNELIFPTEEFLSATHSFMALSEGQIRRYEGEYNNVTGG